MKTIYKTTCARLMTLLVLALLSVSNVWGADTWTRVTTIKELTDGGTFIMGYEATAKSGIIVPLRSKDCNATTSANGYFNTGITAGSSTNGTIDMSKVTETADYEVYITSPASGKINIQMKDAEGNFYGATSGGSTSNKGRLYTSGNSTETNLTPEFSSETDNQFMLTGAVTGQYKYLKYNTGSPRFAFYNSAGSNIVFYKKETGPTKLSTPTGLKSANITQTSAGLSWTAVDNASSYTLAYKKTADTEFTETAFTSGSTLDGLSLGTEYTWKVKAVGDGTNYSTSDYSETSTFTTVSDTKYTVTFNAGTNGTCETTSLEEESAGAGVELPSCIPNSGYAFIGWSTTSDATEADAGEANATYHPTANIILYAVYKEVYTITWSVNGASTTEGNPTTSVVEGKGITTLPTTPADISGMKFQGWTATQIATSSATAPTDLFTDAEHAPSITANTTFYAVFAEESTVTETLVIKDYANANSWTSSQAYTSASTANVTFTGAGTGNNCKYYSSDQSWRFYSSGNGAITITAKENITKVELSGTSFFTTPPTGWSYSDKAFTPDAQTQTKTVTISNGSNTSQITQIAVTYCSFGNYCTSVVVKELTEIEVTGTPANFWKGETFNHDGITVTAHYENAEDEDVTEKAEFTGYDMASAGEQTVTVTYDTKSTTYNITVKTIANTQETAYTVAEAKAIIDANPAELKTTEVYVKGKVSEIVTVWSEQYGNISFNVSADGEATGNQFQFYRNFKGANKAPWASATDVPGVGEDVIGFGKLTKHNTTYEFAEGNYIVSRSRDIKISDVGYATACVPFDATVSGDVTAYYVSVEDGNLVKTPIAADEHIVGETGVLLKSNNGGEATATFTTVELDEDKVADAWYDNQMKGSLEGETFSGGATYYILANDETNGLGFYYQGASGDGTSAKCAAGKAVLAVPAGAGIKSFFSLDDETTSIHNSQFTIHNSENDVMYNLNGQVVGKDYKGIVIVNGKKMLNK